MQSLGRVLHVCALFLATTTLAFGAPGDTAYAHPGALLAAGGTRLNFYCMGSGSPTVIFDGGWGDWSPSWAVVQPQVAKWMRACSFDRAGYGFSDPGPMPRTSVRVADELHAALHAAGITGPYLLVAHAFGSYNLRVFADRYMREVGGIVLIDADEIDVEPAKWQERDLRDAQKIVAETRACRNAVVQRKGGCPRRFFRGIPEKVFSATLNAVLLHQVQTQTSLYDAAISEMEQLPANVAYLQKHVTSFGSRPIRVLTTWHFGLPPSGPPKVRAERLEYEHDAALAQGSWLRLSTNAKQIFDYSEGRQYIQLDQPQVVLAAIHDVMVALRGSR
jgi:pimeloyl-ACP methyl ester carboxylesterase